MVVMVLLPVSAGGADTPTPVQALSGNLLLNVTDNGSAGFINGSGLNPEKNLTPTPVPVSSVEYADFLYSPDFRNSPRLVSVGYASATDGRIKPRLIYSEQGLILNNTPIGRILTIVNGPFVIQYAIHPKVNNPNFEWATLEVWDPWGNQIADGGYNRNYPGATSQQIAIYRTGTFYLKIDGNFVILDIGLQTTDPTPSVTPTPPPQDEV